MRGSKKVLTLGQKKNYNKGRECQHPIDMVTHSLFLRVKTYPYKLTP